MCYDDKARPPAPPGNTGHAEGEDFELTAGDGNRFMAYRATPSSATMRAGVLILPDVRGLFTFYKELAMRFAEIGIPAIAMDYFGRTAGTGSRDESFVFMPHVDQITFPGVLADATASLAALPAGCDAKFALGFCLGGTLSFLCGTSDLPLAGTIGFYSGVKRSIAGAGTLLERAHEVKHPALGLFGGDDAGIPPQAVTAIDAAFDTAGVAHEVITYPGAPHGFFDRRAADFADASADAWQRVLRFITANA
jgi:carboxymethylenebutenolidase